jgi:6-phosphofructokinase 1
MKGAQVLVRDLKELGIGLKTIAIPSSIDNDLWGTDMSLGAASAASAMIEEMQNMLQLAQALRRIFVCEVMGRYCGYLAVETAMGIGADVVIIPEQILQIHPSSTGSELLRKRIMVEATEDNFRKRLKEGANLLKEAFAIGKGYGFVVMSEGIRLLLADSSLDAERVRRYLEDDIKSWPQDDPPDVRAHVVGYSVRGVRPCRFDLWLGARLGTAAIQCFLEGKSEVMVGWSEEQGIIETPFDEVIEKSNRPPQEIWHDRPKWQELLEMQEAMTCPPALRQQLREQGNRFVW